MRAHELNEYLTNRAEHEFELVTVNELNEHELNDHELNEPSSSLVQPCTRQPNLQSVKVLRGATNDFLGPYAIICIDFNLCLWSTAGLPSSCAY